MERQCTVNLTERLKVYKPLNYRQKRCVLCLDKTDSVLTICKSCISDLPFNNSCCDICSKPLRSSSICGDCINYPQNTIDRVTSVFLYQYPINQFLLSLKFNQNLIAGNLLGTLMADQLTQRDFDIDYIVPVPLHYKRLISRGYNQSTCLANSISKQNSITLKQTLCRRIVHTKNQTSLNAQQRRNNISNAFEVIHCVTGKNIALVDDVITTGSTLRELAKTFKAAGAKSIHAWCCAIRVD